ncbi:glass protein, putative, partial [Ixodes scapularis]
LCSRARKHARGMPYKCRLCSTSFGLWCAPSHHVERHACSRPFECATIRWPSLKRNLAWHTRTHAVDGPFKCQEVRKSFAHKSTLSGTFKCTCEALREPT